MSEYLLAKAREWAEKNGGKCLSEQVLCSGDKLGWQCENGHIWAASYRCISEGHWCAICRHKTRTIEEMREIAESRGGKCLSESYINTRTKLLWQCERGHTWEAMPTNVVHKGKWCPYCRSWSSEEICRRYFETIFGCKFNKVRPDWLVGANGFRLELDGMSDITFNEKYLAFEHDGLQHYTNRYSKGKIEYFETLQLNDVIKTKLCSENNVILFRIPELFSMTKMKDFKSLIKNIAAENGLDINVDVEIDLSGIYSLDRKVKKYRDIVEKRGGKILGDYINSGEKIKILCDKGHVFEMTPDNIKAGHWCCFCAGRKHNRRYKNDLSHGNNLQ